MLRTAQQQRETVSSVRLHPSPSPVSSTHPPCLSDSLTPVSLSQHLCLCLHHCPVCVCVCVCVLSRSVVSDSLWPLGLQPTKLLCPWDFRNELPFCPPGHLPTQRVKLHLLRLLHWQVYSLPLSHLEAHHCSVPVYQSSTCLSPISLNLCLQLTTFKHI